MEFATLHREWRTARGLSLSALARKAGVSKAALSYWESGARRPGVPELEAVLDALGVSPEERTRALALVGAPRAVRRLRELAEAEPDEGPPLCGDLLRAMRRRVGLRLEDAASLAGVSAPTLSRWERTESWPEPPRLHALCRVLGARPEEVAALTSRGLPLDPEADDSEEALDALRERLRAGVWRGDRALMDLRFLALEARLWSIARSSRGARRTLSLTYAHHAQWLSLWGRGPEAERYAYRAIDLQEGALPDSGFWFWAVHVAANRAAGEGAKRDPLRKARMLEDWLPLTTRFPRIESWFRLNLAGCFTAAGATDRSLKMHRDARELDLRSGGEARHTSLGLAETLILAGDADAALPYLPAPRPEALPVQVLSEHLVWARAMLGLGDRPAAHSRLNEAYALLNGEPALASSRPRVEEVARLLEDR